MARIRTIKPEFWTDEKIVELDMSARLFFIGLWNLCDDHGRMEYSPKRIKLQLFPQDRIDVAKTCAELREFGLINIYSVQGREYLEVINFSKHQQIKNKDRESRFPAPPDSACEDLRGFAQNFSQERKGKEGKGREGKGTGSAESASQIFASEIFEFWKSELNHPQAKLDDKRRKAIQARIAEGYTPERIRDAIKGIKTSPHNMGKNDRNTVYDDIELICRSGANVDRFADMLKAKEEKQNVAADRFKYAF